MEFKSAHAEVADKPPRFARTGFAFGRIDAGAFSATSSLA
jgi:hypothetical protein